MLNGSPLFTGGAGSGESEIRRHVLESDLVEAIVALPTDMFYNTGIATCLDTVEPQSPCWRNGSGSPHLQFDDIQAGHGFRQARPHLWHPYNL